MDLSARPLLGTPLDLPLFSDREPELEKILRGTAAGLNSLVLGEHGFGKSSLLNMIEHRLAEDPGFRPISLQGVGLAESPEEILSLLAFRLEGRRSLPEDIADLKLRLVPMRPGVHEPERIIDALAAVRKAIANRHQDSRPVVLLDGLPAAELGFDLFGRLRDELWALQVTWIVAAHPDESFGFLRPPASEFFEQVVRLEALDDASALNLLERRVGPEADPEILRQIVEAADGSPRALIESARRAYIDLRSPTADAASRQALRRRAVELGDPAMRLLEVLEAHGPASASDPEFLRKLGWGRSRAAQVLRKAEEAGLIQGATHRHGESGRPRKLYALVDESEKP